MASFKTLKLTPKYIKLRRSFRFLFSPVHASHTNKFHTCNIILQKEPIKFTTSKAAEINFPDIKPSTEDLWYKNYVIVGSLLVFLLYFLCIREENDIDEMLKGNEQYQSSYYKLVDLQIKLHYCEQNKLPTKKLKEKIKILKKELNIPDYD